MNNTGLLWHHTYYHAGSVSCGGHSAARCSACGSSRAFCNGDCYWSGGRCRFDDYYYDDKYYDYDHDYYDDYYSTEIRSPGDLIQWFISLVLPWCHFEGRCQCGLANSGGSDYIEGGSEVTKNKYPWLVYVFVANDFWTKHPTWKTAKGGKPCDDGRKHNPKTNPGYCKHFGGCTATLISDRHVLIAAHCIVNCCGINREDMLAMYDREKADAKHGDPTSAFSL